MRSWRLQRVIEWPQRCVGCGELVWERPRNWYVLVAYFEEIDRAVVHLRCSRRSDELNEGFAIWLRTQEQYLLTLPPYSLTSNNNRPSKRRPFAEFLKAALRGRMARRVLSLRLKGDKRQLTLPWEKVDAPERRG